jgi:hypothetical protein
MVDSAYIEIVRAAPHRMETDMPVARILSAILVLLAFVMGLRHGVDLLRSTPSKVEETLHISLNQPTILVLGFLTCLGAFLVLFPPTFFAANFISAAVILYLAASQSRAHNLRGALVELPFVLLPLLVLYLGYPFKYQPLVR